MFLVVHYALKALWILTLGFLDGMAIQWLSLAVVEIGNAINLILIEQRHRTIR